MKNNGKGALKAETSQQGRRIILRIARTKRPEDKISKELPGKEAQIETDPNCKISIASLKSVIHDGKKALKNEVNKLKSKCDDLEKSHEDLKRSFDDLKNFVEEKVCSQNQFNKPKKESRIEILNKNHAKDVVEMDNSDFQNPYSFEQPMKKIKSEYVNDQSAEIQRLNEVIRKLKEENVKLIKDNRNLSHGHGSRKG